LEDGKLKTPRAGLSAGLAIFGRQTKAFEPAIPKGAVYSKVLMKLFPKVSSRLPRYRVTRPWQMSKPY
jgi:hypothetical protein